MGEIIAVAHHAGGVGKTNTTVNLGYALAAAGQRVLLCDLDPQGNLSEWLGAAKSPALASALQTGTRIEPGGVQRLAWGGVALDIIASHLDTMAGVELALVGVITGREQRLRRALEWRVPEYDYILIDCPPSLSLLTVCALYAADRVLVPVQAQPKAYEQIPHIVATIWQISEYRATPLDTVQYVLTMVERTTVGRDVEAALRASYAGEVLQTVIPKRVRAQEGSQYHAPLAVYSPDCEATRAYSALAQEVMGHAR